MNAARQFKEIQADTCTRARRRHQERAARADHGRRRRAQAAAKRKDEGEKTTAVARELRTEIAPAQEDTALQGYIVARRREIAAEVGTGLD